MASFSEQTKGFAPRRGAFRTFSNWSASVALQFGALPFFLVGSLLLFTILSRNFLSVDNLVNVARQSVYLILVSLGQMLVLVSGGLDLSVGTTIALTSVTSSLAMIYFTDLFPNMVWVAIAMGIPFGLLVALIVGVVNGVGIAWLSVSPFIMTLGTSSVCAGLALFLTGGVPVDGLPPEFGDALGFGRLFGVPVPVLVTIVFVVLVWFFASRTRAGIKIYAVGGNIKAAHLSGILTTRTLVKTYALCALVAGLTGLLLTARVGTGEANMGASFALESIAACVIAGVSLRGGIGRVESVVLGALFIVLVQNGMNLIQISSYLQMVLLGGLLILAVVLDQLRFRYRQAES